MRLVFSDTFSDVYHDVYPDVYTVIYTAIYSVIITPKVKSEVEISLPGYAPEGEDMLLRFAAERVIPTV